MLGYQGQAAAAVILLNPVSAANTAAATSGWIDVRGYEGDLVIVNQVGALTGSITWTIEDATDGSGTDAAGITPNEGAYAAGAATQIQKRTVGAGACRGWVRCVGTIVTGPALVAASLLSRPEIYPMSFGADAALFLSDFGEDLPRNGGAAVRVIFDEPGVVSFAKLYSNADDGLVRATRPSVTVRAGTISVADTLVRNGVTYQVTDLDPAVDGEFVTAALTRL